MLCILGDIINYGPRNGLPEGLDPKGIVERLNPLDILDSRSCVWRAEFAACRFRRFYLWAYPSVETGARRAG